LIKVVEKLKSDLYWSFNGNNASFNLGQTTEQVDPFPAYAHNFDLVEKEADRVFKCFPITWPVTLYNLPYEFLGRTNAYTQASSFDYSKKLEDVPDGQEQYSRTPFIVFSGKRIPIMPAMTRYLVAHEYGHVIEDWVAKQCGIRDTELLEEYRKLRKLDKDPISYGGGWHKTVGEIFANDFRIIITKAETEFWPHECSRPESVPKVVNWWKEMKKKYAVQK
jgi:hypothetical protein